MVRSAGTRGLFVCADTLAHSGAKSCKVCMDTNGEMNFSRDAVLTGHEGETYVADVWLRDAANSATMEERGFRSDDLDDAATRKAQ